MRLRRLLGYAPLSLLRLPSMYNQLFESSNGPAFVCTTCNQRPHTDDAALCLVCGALLCSAASCCRSETGTGELSRHTKVHPSPDSPNEPRPLLAAVHLILSPQMLIFGT